MKFAEAGNVLTNQATVPSRMTSPTDSFDLPGFLPYRMTVAAEKLSTGLAKRYRDDFGISIAEWRVLVHVADAGAVSIRELCKRVSLEKSKASRAATRLEAAGYLKKAINDQDRRLVALTLTSRGTALMNDLVPIAATYQQQLDDLLSPYLNALDIALDRISDADL